MFKITKTLLRIWWLVTSMGAFIFGWIVFAHAPKPVSAGAAASDPQSPQAELAPLPTLAPLPPLGQPAVLQPLPVQPSLSFSLPRLRSRGS